MARGRNTTAAEGSGCLFLLLVGVALTAISIVAKYAIVFGLIALIVLICYIIKATLPFQTGIYRIRLCPAALYSNRKSQQYTYTGFCVITEESR